MLFFFFRNSLWLMIKSEFAGIKHFWQYRAGPSVFLYSAIPPLLLYLYILLSPSVLLSHLLGLVHGLNIYLCYCWTYWGCEHRFICSKTITRVPSNTPLRATSHLICEWFDVDTPCRISSSPVQGFFLTWHNHTHSGQISQLLLAFYQTLLQPRDLHTLLD